jgi:hypothetical protein
LNLRQRFPLHIVIDVDVIAERRLDVGVAQNTLNDLRRYALIRQGCP